MNRLELCVAAFIVILTAIAAFYFGVTCGTAGYVMALTDQAYAKFAPVADKLQNASVNVSVSVCGEKILMTEKEAKGR